MIEHVLAGTNEVLSVRIPESNVDTGKPQKGYLELGINGKIGIFMGIYYIIIIDKRGFFPSA